MKAKKLIYVKATKQNSAGYLTERQFKNWTKEGYKLKVNDKNKKIANEIKKEVKQQLSVSQKENKPESRKSSFENVGGIASTRSKSKSLCDASSCPGI